MCQRILAFLFCAAFASSATAVTITFDTEDDFSTALINGQIVDAAFDNTDLEFGNLFTLSSTQIGGGSGHLGATIFDTDPNGPNQSSQDPDLLIDQGNILILQSNNPGSAGDTSVDGSVGLVYDNPNDEADFGDRGSVVFSFLSPVFLQSFELVDANGGFGASVILTDQSNNTRTFTVNSMFSKDINTCGVCDGFQLLDLTNLAVQVGEGGGTASGVEDLGFDANDVISLEIQFIGNPSSGGLDNLTFIPEPALAVLLACGMAAWGLRSRA